MTKSKRPLRVVQMAGTANGAPWMIAFLCEQKRMGHDVMAFISGTDGTIAPILEREGIPFRIIQQDLLVKFTPLSAWRRVRELVKLLLEVRPDVLHTHLFPSVMIGRLAGWLADVPLRFGMIAGPYSLEAPILRDLESGLAWMDTKVIASCEFSRTLLVEQHVPREHIELIYYAVDQSRHDPAKADGGKVRRELGIAPDQPVIGMVAYFYPLSRLAAVTPPHMVGRGAKGHDVLLRAVPRILEELPDAKIVLVGKGWSAPGEEHERDMHKLAKELGLSSSVIFTGERSDVPDVLASLDVSVHCSLSENLGGSVESLLMERPMVVSNVGGLVDTVLHEKTGLVVPPDDPGALAEAILRLFRDRPAARRLGESGRKWMLERFTLDRTVADFEELYQRELDRAPRGYRPLVRAWRTMLFPFRVGPVAYRTLHDLSEGAPFRRIIRRILGRLYNLLRPRRPDEASETR